MMVRGDKASLCTHKQSMEREGSEKVMSMADRLVPNVPTLLLTGWNSIYMRANEA